MRVMRAVERNAKGVGYLRKYHAKTSAASIYAMGDTDSSTEGQSHYHEHQ